MAAVGNYLKDPCTGDASLHFHVCCFYIYVAKDPIQIKQFIDCAISLVIPSGNYKWIRGKLYILFTKEIVLTC